jgi:GDP-D-mannose dehydratase
MNMTKVRLATGIAGPDGLHLMGAFLRKGYEAHSACQVSQVFNNETVLSYISGLIGSFRLTRDMPSGEVYSLVVRSHEVASIESSEYIAEINGACTLQLLGVEQKVSYYQA